MAICGLLSTDQGQPIETRCLETMVSALAMGTGDVRAQCSAPLAGFGAVSASNTSSVFCSDAVTVGCDVDLYNGRELQGSVPTMPVTASSAALIATLYLNQGESFIQKLRGVFSLAIWDRRSRALLLARDRFGVKPLCYAARDSELIFASHPRGIFASRRMIKKPFLPAIVNYLNYNVVPAPDTAFEGVSKVKPGEYVVWKNGKARAKCYWELQYSEDADGSVEQLASELLSRIEAAVRVTSADLNPARIGCFLSGGTDSSTVVGLLTRIKRHPANTFSIGFVEGRFNEIEYARLAARHFQTHHFESILRPEDAYEAIPKIVDGYDEPFANASAIPTYCCARVAKDHGMEAMLAGDGGDELFGGNERYRTHQMYRLYQTIPRALRRVIEPIVFASPTVGVIGKAQRYIRRSNTPNPERYCVSRLFQTFPPEHVLGAAMPSVNGDALALMRSYYNVAPVRSELNRLLYIDIKMTLGDEDLPKVARTAELAGISVRFPYLDYPLAEFSGRLPVSLKVRGFEKRYLFKQATRNLLPREILKKKKHGFGLPIGVWLKTDPKLRNFCRDVLLDSKTYQRGYFQRQFIEQLMANLEQDNTPYFGDLLWVFLMLELWHRRHMEAVAS